LNPSPFDSFVRSPAHFLRAPFSLGRPCLSLFFFFSFFSLSLSLFLPFSSSERLVHSRAPTAHCCRCLSLPPLLPVFSKIVSELAPSSLPPPSCAALENLLVLSRPCLAAPPWSKKYLTSVQPDATRRRLPRRPHHRRSELQARAPLSHQPSRSPSCRIQSESSRPL
jgi:hypothetical protein